MTPYYEHAGITIYNGDCREILPGLSADHEQSQRQLPHPAARRLHHVRWLCKWFGGASVTDPFGGSGTTAVACKELGIPCTLIEIEERYCEIAAKRLSQEVFEFEETEK